MTADDALRCLARALAPELAPLIVAALRDANAPELVVLSAGVPALATGRALLDAHRRGELAGVTRVSRKLVAPRESIDAWLASRPVSRRARQADAGAEGLARVGLRIVSGAS